MPNYTTNHHLDEEQHQPDPQSIHLLRHHFPRHQVRRAELIYTLYRLQRPDRRLSPQYDRSRPPGLACVATTKIATLWAIAPKDELN
ncbi:hypothetical protein QUA36_01170 [Microcoleus sp. Pol10D4]